MGKTSFDGPVYGAKSLLWTAGIGDVIGASTTANTFASITVPAGEDWYITGLHAYRGSTHSTAFVLALVDDSTTIANVAITSSLAGQTGSTQLSVTSGEYEGQRVAAGSVLTLTVHNGGSSVASSQVGAWVYGFPRWLQTSSRGF